MGEYADLFADDSGPAASMALRFGVEAQPDQAAETAKLARRYGVPPNVALEFREDYKKRAQVEDARAAVENSPKLRGWLAVDPVRAEMAHDDVQNLGAFEAGIRVLKNIPRAVGEAFPRAAAGLYGLGAAAFEVPGQAFRSAEDWLAERMGAPSGMGGPNAGELIGGQLRELQRGQEAFAKLVGPQGADGAGILERGLYSGLTSATQTLATIPVAAQQGSASAAAVLLGLVEGGSSYGRARERGVSPAQAAVFGAENAVAEVVTEMLPMAKLLGDMKAGTGAAKMLINNLIREVPGELAATTWQGFNEWANLNPDRPVTEWLETLPEELAVTLVATMVGGGAQIGAIAAVQKATDRIGRRDGAAGQADQVARQAEQLAAMAEASALRGRDAETFKDYVAQIADETGDDPTEFYVDAEALRNSLNQSGITMEEMAAIAPVAAGQLVDALRTGTDVRVPVSEFIAAGQQFTAPLIDHLKTSPDAMTRAEAQAFMKERGAEIEAMVERELQQKESDDQFRQSMETVRQQFEGELNRVGRFTADVNKAYASLLSNFYGATAARLGMTPEALLQRYGLRVAAQEVGGARALEQGQPISTSKVKDKLGNEFDVTVSRETFGADKGEAAVMVELRDPATGDRRGFVDFTVLPDGTLSAENAKVAPSFQKRGLAEVMYKAARDAGFDIAPGRAQTEAGEKMVASLKRKGLINKERGTLNQSALDGAELSPKSRDFLIRLAAVARDALAGQGNGEPVPVEPQPDGLPSGAQDLTNLPEGQAAPVQEGGLVGEPALIAMLSRMRSAVLNDPQILDAVVGAVPIDVVNNLFGSQGAAKVALHDQAMLKDSPAFNADLPVASGLGDAADSVFLLVREVAGRAAELARRSLRSGVEPKELLAAADARQRNTLNQGASPRAQISFADDISLVPSVISLFAGADLSGFLHESGHFFLEVTSDLASRIQGQIREGASVTEAERAIVADMETLLQWFGVQGGLTEWERMSFEQKTGAHEQFARGFEAYAFEGKAPSIELQSIFQRFRSWLVNIYKQLRNLNVELTEDVRSVMGRMLASEAAIEEAQAQRNLGPLFASAESAGMSMEDYQAYQKLAAASTDKATAELDERMLKDMKWMSRARNKAIKAKQQEVDDQRREIRAGVRIEVMSEPVYRAWVTLTGKAQRALEPSTAETENRQDLADWQQRRNEAEDAAKKAVREELLSGQPELKGLEKGQFLAKNKRQINIYVQQRMLDWEKANPAPARVPMATEEVEPGTFGKLDVDAVIEIDPAAAAILTARKMTAKGGAHPDIVADVLTDETGTSVFDSGDALIKALAAAKPPAEEIELRTDQRMLEMFGDISSPEALQRAADEAVHNELRARVLASELKALQAATKVREDTGRRTREGSKITVDVMAMAAKQYAADIVARLRVRDIRPSQYTAAETRSAKMAEKAFAAGKTEEAATHKRNQLINNFAAKAAMDAQNEVAKTVKYLRKFDKRPTGIDPSYIDQIDGLLERYDLKPATLKSVDRRKAFAAWLAEQEAEGLAPEVPQHLIDAAGQVSYKDMTLEQLRGLRDTVKQIEHLGRLKNRLLTAKEQRDFDRARDAIVSSIGANASGREADTRTPNTVLGQALVKIRNFGAEHIKAATWARIMDGGKDGPVWEYLIRTANEAGDRETGMRAKAAADLTALLAPVLKSGKLGGKGKFFPSIKRSLNREAILAMALNTGNVSNLQRLLGGEGWTLAQIQPALDTLSKEDWDFVQGVWDYFETFRPQIAEKERRVYGKEPEWIEPTPVVTKHGTYRGGYYPVRFDQRASERASAHFEADEAKRQMQGAYTSATTRRSFTKSRVEEVRGRPLLYALDGVYSGLNEVIHDLSWHEWLIDANKIIRDEKVSTIMRETYGPEVHAQFKEWLKDVATGDRAAMRAGEQASAWLRQGVTMAGLGFNIMNALIQPLGITQSIVRVGPQWVGKGVGRMLGSPVGAYREASAKSSFMRTRSLTRLRELNEVRNAVKGQTAVKKNIDAFAYTMMLRAQQLVDVPTWWGAYEKAIADGNADDRAIALADQAVIDSQGSGMTKDLSAIERGGPTQKLFTTFYGFFNSTLNLGVAQAMTSTSKAKLATDMLMLFVVPSVLGTLLKEALVPGGDDDPEKLVKKLISDQISYLLGMMVYLREATVAVQAITGTQEFAGGYSGPAGLRMLNDLYKFGQQVNQGEADDALRKASVNLAGDLFGLPAAQVNRSITGAEALIDDQTDNPAALLFGYQEPR